MRQENEQIDYEEQELDEKQQAGSGESADSDSLRKRIGSIGSSLYAKGLISRESADFYSKIENKAEDPVVKVDVKMLKDVLAHAEKLAHNGGKIYESLTDAVKKGYASEKDRGFLINEITHHHDFINKFPVAEKLIADKIDRMKKDREEYDKIANHKLVRNVGYLKVDAAIKIMVPGEKAYLGMTVPDRRELLKKLNEALPKAEKYAEKTGQVESKELTEKYKGLLDKAYGKKIIGKKTYEKFLDGFKKIDKSEKETWVKEFPEQMVRYEKLWQEIRSSLKGKALDHMESLRDEKGYTELFTEFGKTRDAEKNRMDKEYDAKLEKFIQQGVIGKNTAGEFKKWMKSQDLESKYDAFDKLHDGSGGQMERYKKLHDDIGKNLSGKQQEYIRSKLDGWGYAETKAQYDRFMKGEKLPSDEGASKESNALAAIRSTAVKAAIVETEIALKEKGADKKKTFLSSIKRIFRNERRDEFDAKGFQTRLHKDREQLAGKEKSEDPHEEGMSASVMDLQQKLVRARAKSNKPEEKTRKNLHEVDKSGIEEEMSELEGSGRAHVLKEEGFKQVESIEDGRTQRKTQVEINREKGMNKFLSEDSKRSFRGKAEGGKDDVSLAVHMQDGRAVELNLGDIRAMEKYFEEKDAEQKAA